jgi:hypothetical protein
VFVLTEDVLPAIGLGAAAEYVVTHYYDRLSWRPDQRVLPSQGSMRRPGSSIARKRASSGRSLAVRMNLTIFCSWANSSPDGSARWMPSTHSNKPSAWRTIGQPMWRLRTGASRNFVGGSWLADAPTERSRNWSHPDHNLR